MLIKWRAIFLLFEFGTSAECDELLQEPGELLGWILSLVQKFSMQPDKKLELILLCSEITSDVVY